MREFSAFALVLTVAALGCVGDSMLVREDPADVAAKAPKLVPIEGLFTFQPDLADGFVDCGGGFVFPQLYRAKGDVSHLGHTTVLITLDECWLEAEPVPHLVGVGTGDYTAANGDHLYGEYVMPTYLDPEGGPMATYDLEPIEYVGGTGRFDGVTGDAVGAGTMSVVTGAGSYWIRGMLESVGSIKQ